MVIFHSYVSLPEGNMYASNLSISISIYYFCGWWQWWLCKPYHLVAPVPPRNTRDLFELQSATAGDRRIGERFSTSAREPSPSTVGGSFWSVNDRGFIFKFCDVLWDFDSWRIWELINDGWLMKFGDFTPQYIGDYNPWAENNPVLEQPVFQFVAVA